MWHLSLLGQRIVLIRNDILEDNSNSNAIAITRDIILGKGDSFQARGLSLSNESLSPNLSCFVFTWDLIGFRQN